ncbi:MAG: DNA-protecting protein DprA [SAR324 cluster bacterium]|nr:DNA-protecting protein DprA [SAR324 cluster bacterium]
MDTLELNWLALNLIPNLGIQTLRQLIQHFESVDKLLLASSEEIEKKCGISEQLAHRIARAKEVSSFQIEQRLIEEFDAELMCLESPNYPPLLKEIAAPPPLIYKIGNLTKIGYPCIAFVGSRSCTSYGKKHTRRLIGELAQNFPNATIVSGLARGIDTIAHQTALDEGLSTIAVLAGGLSNIYPPENTTLAEAIKNQGSLISEFPMGLKPLARNFPIRNRIISGLSHAIVVVEAGIKSGALITAAFGLQHNREVFALPGNVEAATSRGTNRLISRHHAKLIVQAKDIVDELQLSYSRTAQTEFSFEFPQQQTISLSEFSSAQVKILRVLELGTQDIDTLFSQTEIEINELLGFLIELELIGVVQSLEGQRYQLDESIKIDEK